MALRDVSQAGMVPETVDRGAEERHLAAEMVVQPEQPLDQRRLARAVGAQDGDDLTGMDVQGDPGDDRAVGIPEGLPTAARRWPASRRRERARHRS